MNVADFPIPPSCEEEPCSERTCRALAMVEHNIDGTVNVTTRFFCDRHADAMVKTMRQLGLPNLGALG